MTVDSWTVHEDENQDPEAEGGNDLSRRTLLRFGAVGGLGVGDGRGARTGGTLPRAEGAALARRRVRRDLDRARRPAVLHRGLPDQPADPGAVHGPAADPEGAGADADSRSTPDLDEAARARARRSRTRCATSGTRSGRSAVGYPDPLVYKIDLLVRTALLHHLAGAADRQERPADGLLRRQRQAGAGRQARTLPPSTIYGFNGTFPGPMINAEYGKPAPGPLREPPGREPATAWTGRTSAPRTSRS